MEIKDKIALVTGGGHRIGQAISLMLAKAGAHLVIHYHTSTRQADETAETARTLGVKALPIRANVAEYEQVQAMAAQVKAVFGGLDILVNSAGHWEKSPFPSEDLGPWERVTGVTINGAYYVTNSFAPMLLERQAGAIVNIVDLAAWEAWPGFTAHAVSKAALVAMTRQFALELAPKIRVNAVAPGPVLPAAAYGPVTIERIAARTLLERWGTPEDVAQAVKFLLEADYITGETIFVDGGERYGHYRRRSG